MLKDKFGRVHDYLRISLTDKCNFRCSYCLPEDVSFLPEKHLLTKDEILAIADTFVKEYGVNKIRITGGEPLTRKDAHQIIASLSRLNVKLAITTNGVLLDRFFDLFEEIGLTSINISLDTLIPERFKSITKRDEFDTVMDNINRALARNFHVKINTVITKGVNEDEIIDLIEWTRESPVHIRFIEFMPFNGNHWLPVKVASYKEILERIENVYPIKKLNDEKNSTSKAYHIDGFKGTFAVISTVTAPFCESCNRLRLTADGKMRNCLFARKETNLLSALRNGEDIRPLIENEVLKKAHQLGGLPDFNDHQNLIDNLSERTMMKIGG